jgi:DNA-binding SARP family transcriptional activator/TolB-like protein/Tfp pilus assembly protein PilF
MPASRAPHAGKSFRLLTLGTAALVDAAGIPVAEQRRRLALLALVASSGPRGISRDKVIALLSPESPTDSARHSLHQLLYYLRQQVGDDVLLGPDPLRLNPQLVTFDVTEFEGAIGQRAMEAAAALYHGPFLDGFHLAESAEFEEWASRERARLAAVYGDVLLDLTRSAEARGDYTAAVTWSRRRSALDPLSADAALQLMRALAASGDVVGALHSGRTYQAFLRKELESEADPEIEAYAASLQRELSEARERVRAVRMLPSAVGPATDITSVASPTGATAGERPVMLGTTPGRRRTFAWTALGAVAVVASFAMFKSPSARPNGGAQSVAIVPFENVAEDSLDYLAEGIETETVETLSRMSGLRVIPPSVMRQYDPSPQDRGVLGRKVSVEHVLAARLMRERDTTWLSVDVLRSRDGARVGGGRYAMEVQRLPAITIDVIDSVALALGVARVDHLMPHPTDGEAFRLVMRARHYMLSRDTQRVRTARDFLMEAIDRDPAYADAHALLSGVYGILGTYGVMSAPRAFELSEFAARQALLLDSTSTTAIAHHAHQLNVRYWQWEDGERELLRAAAIDPWRPEIWNLIGSARRVTGRFDEAIDAFRRARARDPLARHYTYQIGHAFLCAGQLDSALVALREAIALGTDYPAAHEMAADALTRLERYDEALAEWRIVAQQRGDSAMGRALDGARGKEGLARFLVMNARAALLKLDALPRGAFKRPILLAELYALVGDTAKTFYWLEKALEDRDPSLPGIMCTPQYEPLRSAPRFRALMQRMNLTPRSFGAR